MGAIFRQILDWSEVWALLIPIAVLLKYKKQPGYLKPVKYYVWIALLLNTCADIIWKAQVSWNFPHWLTSNNFLYNLHSVVRLLLFSWFFILLDQRFMHRVKKIIPFLFVGFLLINFIFYENFFNRLNLSSSLLSVEASLLLFYCLQYFIFILLEDKGISINKERGFLIVTALAFYVAANFFIFLFYNYLIEQNIIFAIDIWDVHNLTFLILCISMAITFYRKNET